VADVDHLLEGAVDLRDSPGTQCGGNSVQCLDLCLRLYNIDRVGMRGFANAETVNSKRAVTMFYSDLNIRVVVIVVGKIPITAW
jgi:hypothetical protein